MVFLRVIVIQSLCVRNNLQKGAQLRRPGKSITIYAPPCLLSDSCQRRAAYSTASAFGHHGSNFRLEPWGALFLSAMDVSAGCFPRSPSQALEDLGGISVSGGKR